MTRVQFQVDLSLAAFLKRYGSQGQCEQALAAYRWPQGFACPRRAGSAHSRFERNALTHGQFGLSPAGQAAFGDTHG